MKKINLIVALIALGISVYLLFSNNNDKQAYVDINRLIEGYSRTPVIKKAFEEKAVTAKTNVDSLISNWQKELQDYEKNRASMSKKELELQQQLLASKQQQVDNYRQVIQKQLQEEDQNNTQTVINDINTFVKEYGESHHYDIIFGASGQGNIMYARTAKDITEKVLEALNKDFEGQ